MAGGELGSLAGQAKLACASVANKAREAKAVKWGKPSDYLYVMRITNSASYSRRLMQWLSEQNPDLHKRMEGELAKARKQAKDDPPAWLMES
jgi:hypothetical protein